ncbi:MAG TPA: undecaprenyl-diphosphatase UppP [Lacipirellulaceae bacterium]|nr:undecaprenyl-diphosphatase UppP [Lacipirellulaceae bacterium]
MSLLHAIIYGLIQGLTEFIPVSSTAHLTIAGHALGDIASDEQWTAFMAVIQLGTLLAVIVYYFSDLIKIARGFFLSLWAAVNKQPISDDDRKHAKLGWCIIVGTLPVAVLGLALKKLIEGPLTKDLRVIAGSLIGLAIVLAIAELVGKQRRDIERLTLWDALIVGFAQVCALIPGSSRSGTTITGGLFAGLTRETAAHFSFLLSIPAVGASGLLELPKALHSMHGNWTAVVVATIISAITGYLSIALLLAYLKSHSTFVFIGYRIVLGLLLFGLIAAQMMPAHS